MYKSLEEICEMTTKEGKPFWKIVQEDDCREQGISEGEAFEQMRGMYQAMREADDNYDGKLKSASGLVGTDGEKMHAAREAGTLLCGKFIGKVMEKALKTGESNACMKRIVAAPTAGSCGVVPAVFRTLEEEKHFSEEKMVEALYVAAHQIDTVVLDKTGTITQGKPVVTDIICAAGKNADKTQLLQIAGSLEKGSEHPLAEAIVNYCVTNNIFLEKVTDFNALFGKGIEGTVSGTHYYAGNEKMMEEKGISLSTEQKNQIRELAKQGRTPLLFADENQFLGIVAVADVVKPTSKEAVQKFRDYGIHVIMLTGDNEVTAQAIKEQVGIDEVIAGVLPTQKEEKISALKQAGHKVAMIGDGVNDAPALASADVGIAIGAGTDVAIESADIVLMKNDLLDAVGAVKLSRAVIRNIKENLFWAFFYNSIGIPLAAGVLYPLFQIKLNPMFGAAAMSLSSVCVVSNALRLRWVKLHDAKKTQIEPHQDVVASTIADINQHNALDNNIKSTNNDKGESTMTTTISIEGMMCAHCQAHVEKALKEVAGVTEVTVNLENKNAVVTGDASVEALKQAVVDAGYEVTDVK